MEPLTHFLTGACIGRAGLNRKTAYATIAAVLAAEAADLDVIWGFAGPVEGLKHHRGITHTLIGAPFVAAAALGVVWLYDRWRTHRLASKAKSAPPIEPGAPVRPGPQAVRWLWIYIAAMISALSHILLDWTNNYGVRPFFPFNPRWYAGSFVFIVEPVLWALLLAALIIPALFGLADREIGARRTQFRGRGWAIFALTGMGLLWCLRYAQHAQAEALLNNTQVTNETALRVGVEPYPVNPFRWHGILETPSFFQTAEVNTRSGDIDSEPARDQFAKPAVTHAVEAAKRTELGKVYLDWGSWAIVRDLGPVPIRGIEPPQLPPGREWTTVQFSDLRFGYDFRGTGRSTSQAPLGATVYIIDGAEEAGSAMGGRGQK